MQAIADGIWGIEGDFRLPGGVVFRSRMTVLDLGDGELLLHSPVDPGDTGAAAIAEHGEVRWIVAPNDLHNSDLAVVAARYPGARVCAGAGVRAKVPGTTLDHGLENGPPDGWGGRLVSASINGAPRWNEHVLFHPASRTLICADFVFNIRQIPNTLTRLVLMMVGCERRFAQSRSIRWVFMRDREALARSVDEVMSYDFDRIVMCHGDVVEAGGHEMMSEAVRWIRPDQLPALQG